MYEYIVADWAILGKPRLLPVPAKNVAKQWMEPFATVSGTIGIVEVPIYRVSAARCTAYADSALPACLSCISQSHVRAKDEEQEEDMVI